MTRFHRAGMVLAGIAGTLLSFAGATAAIASETTLPPPSGGSGTRAVHPYVHTVVTGGMPGWQISLIAIAAALAAAVAAVMLDRARTARRRVPLTPSQPTRAAVPQ
jgi:hypothetical protein